MSAFTGIDLSALPAPDIVQTPDFEAIVADMKTHMIAAVPEIEAVLALESDPLIKLIETFAYRETVLRARINDAAKGVMLAFAAGADLDNLAAIFGVERQVVQTENASVNPPRPLIMEDDARLRRRTQLAPEGFASAGPVGAYIAHGLSADADVKDISAASPKPDDIVALVLGILDDHNVSATLASAMTEALASATWPGVVQISVLSNAADGAASDDLIATVEAALNHEDVRPLTDQVQVQSANIHAYRLSATLTLYDGPDAKLVREAANAAAQHYVQTHHALGHDITVSGLHAALHQAGVQKVTLHEPQADIVVDPASAAYCEAIDIEIGGRDV